MTRQCHRCQRRLRPDENEYLVQETPDVGPTVSYFACTGCFAALSGQPDPGPPVYEPGRLPEGYYGCGICKGQFHESLNPTLAIRLAAEDVNGDGIGPGQYMSCDCCVEKYKPRIAARLARTCPGFQFHVLRARGHTVDEANAIVAGGAAGYFEGNGVDPVAFVTGHWLQ